MQVRLEAVAININNIAAVVRAGQTSLNISSKYLSLSKSQAAVTGGRNSNATPATKPCRCLLPTHFISLKPFYFMQVYYDKLTALLDTFPTHNSQRGIDKLSKIFTEYKSILDVVNKTNDDLKRNTNMHYTELDDIMFDIKQSQLAKSQKQKDQSFKEAIDHLHDDISSLARLIKPHD